ncbi:MAG: hypothetical protein N2167_02905 [Flavobacteriales bacterium]|nr:hypothetical protein [Flavobacteriales bacterium]
MKITLESEIIPLDAENVFSNFNESLFKAINPWFMPMKVELFEGCLPGHRVIVRLGGPLIDALWVSEIIFLQKNGNEIMFIDIGKELPFPLKNWEHRHRIIKTGNKECKIMDEITYHTFHPWLDFIIKPIMHLQFGVRKKKYSQYFCKLSRSKI